ncbi:MAG: tRNA uridine(34) 5-carboxymethylaminomethyl modification radical SAM/GNAT enzyme Elp3 [Promethearchaeota archaeon]
MSGKLSSNGKKIDQDQFSNSEQVIQKTSRAIIEFLLEHPNLEKRKLTAVKCRYCKKYHYNNVIKDSIITKYATPDELSKISNLLKRRLTRTLSGVTIVAVMTAPEPAGTKSCPGECIFCPGTDSQPGEKVAQSYTGREPAAMRSAMYKYDPYEQTLHRMIDIQAIGHHVDKIELIIMGGTFLYFPKEYQDWFMQGCYDAVLNFRKPNFNNNNRSENLAQAKKLLETAETRLIGITFETRPDYCFEEHVDRMLELGATRIEIGIQSTRDELLTYSHRNHTVADNKRAIQVAKDSGIKVNAHMMPNLPLSSPQTDIEIFRELFSDEDFRPDMLKIYPCLVVQGTKLYDMYKKGEFTPYPQEEIVKVIAKAKNEFPRYVRIQRIQRDIPVDLIVAGVKNSNLRQIVHRYMDKNNLKCHCIRCREEGFYAHQRNAIQDPVDFSNVEFRDYEYKASSGTEHFLSFENFNKDELIGFLRLRFPSPKVHRPEFQNQKTAIIREIRVVGQIVGHTDKPGDNQIQHRGYGKMLMVNAEEIAKKNGFSKLLVIAGIGVREYFYNLGYKPDGPYVSKNL